MLRLRLAIATRSLGVPFKQAIRTAAEFGADAVQIDCRHELNPAELSATGRRQFLHQLNELNLRVASVSFPTRRGFCDPDQLESRIAATKRAMEFARQLNAPLLTLRTGRIPDDSESKDYKLLVDVLNDLTRYGNQVGTTLAISSGRDSMATVQTLLAAVTMGPIGIDFDPASVVIGERNAGAEFRAAHSMVQHIRVRDGVGDVDGGGIEVPVGRGDVQWDEMLVLIDESEYNDWMTVDRTTGDDRPGDIQRAIQYLRTVAGDH